MEYGTDLTLDWLPQLLVDLIERAVLSSSHSAKQPVQVTTDLRIRTGMPAFVFTHVTASPWWCQEAVHSVF